MISEEEFTARVELLKRRDPTNPLLPVLRSYSSMAVTYLKHAMRGLEKEPRARTQVQRLGTEEPTFDTPEWVELQRRKSQLYGRRFNLSNQFHDHTATDKKPHDRHACANISDEIRRIQIQIAKVQRQIKHYQRTGEVKEEVVEVEREYEGLALWRRYRTVKQNVNRWTARLQKEGPHQDDITRRKWEQKLKDYEHELEGLREQLDEAAL